MVADIKKNRKRKKKIGTAEIVYTVLPFNRFTSGTKWCLKQKRDLKEKEKKEIWN